MLNISVYKCPISTVQMVVAETFDVLGRGFERKI